MKSQKNKENRTVQEKAEKSAFTNGKLSTLRLKLKNLDARRKALICAALAVLVAASVFVAQSYRYPKKSRSVLVFQDGPNSENLSAMNRNAVRGRLSYGDYAFFCFTEKQRNEFRAFYEMNTNAALTARIILKSVGYEKLLEYSQAEQPFFMGFLYDGDFNTKTGDFSGSINERILGGADLRNFIVAGEKKDSKTFDISLALEKNLSAQDFPRGFLVYTALPLEIKMARIEEAKIGYDLTEEIQFYGLPSNGGLAGDLLGVDFTGATNVFPVVNSNALQMPKILVRLSENPELEEVSAEGKKIRLNAGGEVLTFHKFKENGTFTLQTSMLSNPFAQFSCEDGDLRLSKLLMVANEKKLIPEERGRVFEPLATDPGMIPLSKRSAWRTQDYELYRWENKQNILIFDFKDHKVQGDFFTRLAFFVEKAGWRGKILSDVELEGKHGFNAHDYRAESLADFFNRAQELNVSLNEREKLLKEILLYNGIIKLSENSSGFQEGNGAIVSISQESPNHSRHTLCAHELWHGLFFTDEDFRNTTSAIFYTIDQRAVDFLVAYWTTNPSLNYDRNDGYLIRNEFMAYILQNRLENVSNYFVRIANFNSSRNNFPQEAHYIDSTKAAALEDAARAFDSYVNDRWGLECGRVALVTR